MPIKPTPNIGANQNTSPLAPKPEGEKKAPKQSALPAEATNVSTYSQAATNQPPGNAPWEPTPEPWSLTRMLGGLLIDRVISTSAARTQSSSNPANVTATNRAVHAGVAAGSDPWKAFETRLNRGFVQWESIPTKHPQQTWSHKYKSTLTFHPGGPSENEDEKNVNVATLISKQGLPYFFANGFAKGNTGAIKFGVTLKGKPVVAKVLTLVREGERLLQSTDDGIRFKANMEKYRQERRKLIEHNKLIDEASYGNKVYLIMPYRRIDGFELIKKLTEGENAPPPDVQMGVAIYFLIKGCESLDPFHARGEAFLDVKPDNFLVKDDGSLELGDFGNVTSEVDGHVPFDMYGTPGYCAPEIWFGQFPEHAAGILHKISRKADMWSLAVTVLNLTPQRLNSAYFRPRSFLELADVFSQRSDNPESDSESVAEVLQGSNSPERDFDPDADVSERFSSLESDVDAVAEFSQHYNTFAAWHAEMTDSEGKLLPEMLKRVQNNPRPDTLDEQTHELAVSEPYVWEALLIKLMSPAPHRRPDAMTFGREVWNAIFGQGKNAARLQMIERAMLEGIHEPNADKEALFQAASLYRDAYVKTVAAPATPTQ